MKRPSVRSILIAASFVVMPARAAHAATNFCASFQYQSNRANQQVLQAQNAVLQEQSKLYTLQQRNQDRREQFQLQLEKAVDQLIACNEKVDDSVADCDYRTQLYEDALADASFNQTCYYGVCNSFVYRPRPPGCTFVNYDLQRQQCQRRYDQVARNIEVAESRFQNTEDRQEQRIVAAQERYERALANVDVARQQLDDCQFPQQF